MRKISLVFSCLIVILLSSPAMSADVHPACDGEDNWAAAMVGVHMKNLGYSDKAGGYDKTEVTRLTSEPLGNGIFRQVHRVSIQDGDNSFVAITVNNASAIECSESPVEVYFTSTICGQGPGGSGCRAVGKASESN